jgi:hypothetical protein
VKTSERPSTLHQHLHMYALGATAAGVSMLALAQPGEAEIIYTPTQVYIGQSEYDLDLTGDGTIDFKLQVWSSSIGSGAGIFQNLLRVGHPQAGNGVYPPALRAGASIGPNAGFSSGDYWIVLANGTRFYSNWPKRRFSCNGSWKDKSGRYLGLRFMINGETHYGWARLTTTCRRGVINATLTGYAYETIPNQGLEAGKKKGKLEDESLTTPDAPTPRSVPVPTAATLGMLAKGAQALSVWRRE